VIRPALVSAAFVISALAPAAARADAAAPAAAVQITAADAAPYLGDWTLALTGPNGPGTFNLSVKVEADKVVGEISSEATELQKITSIAKTAKGMALSYSFPYEAMTVDAVVSLTPGTDGKMAAQIDFAGGAYTMTGTATKKEPEKK